MQGGNELKEAFENMKREAKAAVAKAKNEAYKEWYDKMGTEEGERTIYKVAKQRLTTYICSITFLSCRTNIKYIILDSTMQLSR